MAFTSLRAVVVALLLLAHSATAGHYHRGGDRLHHLLLKHRHAVLGKHPRSVAESEKLDTRDGGSCAFPNDDPDLIAVTPGMKNKGWAIAPDMPCRPGMYCPYACAPGKVMAQWKPDSSYTFPDSVNGGLYCDLQGVVSKPFDDKPYCVDGTGSILAVNDAGKDCSFCQTVLPGYEDMLVPTMVGSGGSAVLAVPDPSYWCETSAHYYINPPGVGPEGCIWGHKSKAIGNWTPYVAGANTDHSGRTFVKVGWNPVYMEEPALMADVPTWGVKITCADGDGCNGLPCEIDPTQGINSVKSGNSASGAGGGDFCVVTVPEGKTAKIVVYDIGGSSTPGGDGEEDKEEKEKEEKEKEKEKEEKEKEEKEKEEKEKEEKEKEEKEEKDKEEKEEKEKEEKEKEEKKKAPPTSTMAALTTSTEDPAAPSTTTVALYTTAATPSPTSGRKKVQVSVDIDVDANVNVPTVAPGIFHENWSNGTSSTENEGEGEDAPAFPSASGGSPSDAGPPVEPEVPSQTGEGYARQKGSAAAGLLVALAVLGYLF